MYNLNVNVTTAANSLAVESSCTTPKTPEILNSLMAMSNPFDNCYPVGLGGMGGGGPIPSAPHSLTGGGGGQPRNAASPPEGLCMQDGFAHPGMTCMPPPSVQHTCSQLIKEGLKLTIQSKRKLSGGSDPGTMSHEPNSFCKIPRLQFTPPGPASIGGSSGEDEVNLTAEDAERRRRRRERNKIAATKCRLKKRERTVNLVQESETLETQNHELKSQIQDLENQRRRLVDMLTTHSQTCVKNITHGGSMSPSGPPSATSGPPPSLAPPPSLSNHYTSTDQYLLPDHYHHQLPPPLQQQPQQHQYGNTPQEAPSPPYDLHHQSFPSMHSSQHQSQHGGLDAGGCLA